MSNNLQNRSPANESEEDGTPPDGWSFIPEGALGDEPLNAVRSRIQEWQPEMKFCRVTDLTGEFAREGWEPGIWIEVWREQPIKQADFNPPMTLASPSERGEG